MNKEKRVFKAPENIAEREGHTHTIFLAGSIEMGKAENWQENLSNFLVDKGYIVFNPRRDDWDSTWEQNYLNPQFNQQVNWELNALEIADTIVMYFDPNTQSPISLLELGLWAKSDKLFVICPDGYWKKGNVDIVCDIYNIPLFKSIEEFKSIIK